MTERQLDRANLRRRLARTAMFKSLLVMGSCIGVLLILSLLLPMLERMLGKDSNWIVAVFVLSFFGIPLLLDFILSQTFCISQVRCPYCNASLWKCGSGNFKPRRMKVRDDVHACPGCGAPIV